MRILTKTQAKDLDVFAMKSKGIPSDFLMENAGRAIAGETFEMTTSALKPSIAVVCGKGNNGGDGFAAAHFLKKWGREVDVFSTCPEASIKGDAKQFFEKLIAAECVVKFIKRPPTATKSYSVIIDAMLGTGASGTIRKEAAAWIRWINKQDAKIISADIPSGLGSDNGSFDPVCVKAEKTVTMGFPKLGLMIYKGPESAGEVVTADIGFPKIPNNLKGFHWSVFDESTIEDALPALPKTASKHTQGNVLIIAGSKGMTGAGVLASMAAARSGAGLVKAVVPESLNTVFELKMTEVMTIPCKDNGIGILTGDNFRPIKDALNWCDVAVIGPGLGTDRATLALIKKVVLSLKKPMVIDADALRMFYGNIQLFSKIKAPFVITPHCGELSKILNMERKNLEVDFPETSSKLSQKISGTLVAKNAPTITLQKKNGVINSSGNSGLATGGTGDVLSGLIGGLMTQGMDPFFASQVGVFLHGKAADIVSGKTGKRGMIASDLLDAIPEAMAMYE
ncbi:MAG: NAD(P)H-hydrate dehydratase [Candidatus Marinimicrobia bacterium]|jgi:NAD(P)H-hydrate epimerase|nr:NAD(P)H-hydrate dehydratase [Candidatus Neomarinimicrobiota bacterium]MDP6789665.1 NAD(P)H-hydrate dehydratase [Candidatus Neomarinimicrobiota bacterium]MDP7072913.1 NAD(P)H-hydrate dehydratase [Candidatus Neomarinimicrobiota bacterium]